MPEFSPGARERKKQATRDRLGAAALQLFSEKGFDVTTVDEIAERAGVSPRTFFRYFATKDDVIFSDLHGYLAALESAVTRQPADQPLHTVLCNALVEFSHFLEENAEKLLLRRQLTSTNPTLLPRFLLVQRAWEDSMATALARHLGRPEPTFDERVLAGSGIGALSAAVREWRSNGAATAELPLLTQRAVRTFAAGT